MELISVILPCYNSSKTIQRCFDSLSHQDYKYFEVICINDGSTDDTEAVLDTMKVMYPNLNIRIYNQANAGVSAARNRGLELSNGEYVTFIDPDDFVERQFLSTLYAGIQGCEISVVDRTSSDDYLDEIGSEAMLSYSLDKENYFESLFRNNIVRGFVWNKLYKTSIVKNNTILFSENVTIMEDLEFNVYYSRFVQKATLSTLKLYHYVVNENSALTSRWTSKKMTMIEAFKNMSQCDLSKREKIVLAVDYKRSLMWLFGQLHRLGDSNDIDRDESVVIDELMLGKKLFLKNGLSVNKTFILKYYLPYVFFLLNKNILRFIVKLTSK